MGMMLDQIQLNYKKSPLPREAALGPGALFMGILSLFYKYQANRVPEMVSIQLEDKQSTVLILTEIQSNISLLLTETL